MAVHKVTDENFEERVMKNPRYSVIRFTATWCGRDCLPIFRQAGFSIVPCKALAPIVETISDKPEMSEVDFFVLDIDEQPNTGIRSEFMIRGIPACFIIKDSKVLSSKIGLTNQSDFENWLKSNIS